MSIGGFMPQKVLKVPAELLGFVDGIFASAWEQRKKQQQLLIDFVFIKINIFRRCYLSYDSVSASTITHSFLDNERNMLTAKIFYMLGNASVENWSSWQVIEQIIKYCEEAQVLDPRNPKFDIEY